MYLMVGKKKSKAWVQKKKVEEELPNEGLPD